MNADIKKLKEMTGFSLTTISQALNNPPGNRVKPHTRELVLEAAKKLNYRPNPLAQALKTKKVGMISVIIPDIGNSVYTDIIRAVSRVMIENGYGVAVYDCDRKPENEALYIENAISKKMDGIIMAPTQPFAKYAIELKGYPFVSLSSFASDKKDYANLNYVLANVEDGVYKAASHLIKQGHRNIAMLLREADSDFEFRRQDGFRKAMADNGLPIDESLLLKVAGFDDKAGVDAVAELLKRENKFTALIAYNDTMAIGAMHSIISRGLRIPDDVAIVGGDNIKFSEYLQVPLTTYDINGIKMGEEAAKLLLSQIANPEKKAEKIVIEPDLIIRKSSKVQNEN